LPILMAIPSMFLEIQLSGFAKQDIPLGLL